MTDRHDNPKRWPDDERLADLLAQHATEGLDADDRQAMQQALRADASVDPDAAELAAAAADLAFIEASGATEAMPADLARKLVDLGEREMAEREMADRASQSIVAKLPTGETSPEVTSWFERTGRIGWLAAAAAVVLAVMVYLTAIVPTEPTPEMARAMLKQQPGTIVAEWSVTTEQFEKVTGDVVWSDDKQQGFMRLVGMPVNDPAVTQYQLWIVDPARDERPVDGGVFDVTDTGEVIVPIDAKLLVDKPKAFAITVEKPGGVVKSAGPLHVVAPVAG